MLRRDMDLKTLSRRNFDCGSVSGVGRIGSYISLIFACEYISLNCN